MAPPAPLTPAKGRIAGAIARFLSERGASELTTTSLGPKPLPVDREDWGGDWGLEPVSLQVLTGADHSQARDRQNIYLKWQAMLQDPIISSGMRLHVTAALGGHESKGQMVFIEAKAAAKANKREAKLCEELQKDLGPLFDRISPTVCMHGCTFGDAYARLYTERGVGVRDAYVDELVYPPLIQPYERANSTVGFAVSTGVRFVERLTIMQMARMKLPRMMWIPQHRVIEKAHRVSLLTDDLDALPAVPAMVGGSFLDGAEVAYDKFSAAWSGLVGQRVQASINESLVTVQNAGMTKEQASFFKRALTTMLQKRNDYIQKVVDGGQPVFKGLFHFIPVFNEKQVARIEGTGNAGVSAPFSIEDIMMHGRFLATAIGMDLSLLGFSDQLSGGLGDGGFFRVSAQTAERSRAIRAALSEFLHHIILVHVLTKYGVDYTGQEVPWDINYYSGISALETERQKTRSDAMNSAALMVQVFDGLKNMGLSEEAMAHIMESEMGLDAEDAKVYAKAIATAKPPDTGDGGFGGGGFGAPGGPADGEPASTDERQGQAAEEGA